MTSVTVLDLVDAAGRRGCGEHRLTVLSPRLDRVVPGRLQSDGIVGRESSCRRPCAPGASWKLAGARWRDECAETRAARTPAARVDTRQSAPCRGRPAPRQAPAAQARRAQAKRPTAQRPPQKQPVPKGPRPAPPVTRPWNALWAMMVGFFMILVDSTIVAVANPSIMEHLQTDYDAVIWVTSAYLLAYAVPLLVAGRLGDQFGPKNLYLIGLFVFTAASLWCGLAGSIETLIIARVVQGIGAALLTPQTLSTITRIFPPERRGAAMSVWGATAGVATLVGPLAGGVLVDHLGWQWIFFVNVPIGVIGLALGYWLIPVLPTHRHRFDVLGVLLSGAAMFLVVFGLQEGESRQWPPWIWAMIATGAVLMAAVRLLAGGQQTRTAHPAAHLPGQEFQPGQRRRRGHRLRRHRDDRAADVLRPGGVRTDPHPVGPADRADGGDVRCARPVGRQDRRPGPPAHGDRVRVLGARDRADVVVDRDDARRPRSGDCCCRSW